MSYAEGDRVELVHTTDEYTDLEPGDRGTVTDTDVDRMGGEVLRKTWVDWDDGGKLAMIQGEDRIKKVDDA